VLKEGIFIHSSSSSRHSTVQQSISYNVLTQKKSMLANKKQLTY